MGTSIATNLNSLKAQENFRLNSDFQTGVIQRLSSGYRITHAGDDPAGLADLHIGCVNPEIGPVTLDGAVEESLDPLVDLLAEPRYLALRDAAHPHRLDQIVDRAGGNALNINIGFRNRRGERFLRGLARLESLGCTSTLPENHQG